MSEQDTINAVSAPNTRASLSVELRGFGVKPDGTMIVHSSLRSLGWVCGGAQAVIEALLDTLGLDGTLVMPSQSGGLSDPANWKNPPVPQEWWQTIRDTMPVYDPARTPTREMGAIAELFRTWPGVIRSAHPANSFAAFGPGARAIIEPHELDDPFGETSPLRRLYDHDAQILLIGAGYDRCTALHLAERRAAPDAPHDDGGAPIMVDGARRWVPYEIPPNDSDRFPAIGEWLEEKGAVRIGKIGNAVCRLMAMRRVVDLGTAWLKRAP